MCERCQSRDGRKVQEFTVHKVNYKQKITLCDDCARTYIDADIKLTGGKREAEPEASTEVSEEESTPDEPTAARPSRRRG